MSTPEDSAAVENSWVVAIQEFYGEHVSTIIVDLTTALIWAVVGSVPLLMWWLWSRQQTRSETKPNPEEEISTKVALSDFVAATLSRSVRLSFGSAYDTRLEERDGEGAQITLDQIWTPLRVQDSRTRATKTGSHENMAETDHGMPLEPLLYESDDDLIILGDPGSGKSTSLAATAYYHANAWTEVGDRIPIWVSLATIKVADEYDEIDCILTGVPDISVVARRLGDQAGKRLKQDLRNSILSGEAVILLDGLDEVKGFRLDKIKDAISSIKRRHKVAKVVVTCRAFDYRQNSPNRKLPFDHEIEILPYDFEQQKSYVNNWYNAAVTQGRFGSSQASSLCDALIVELKADEIAELAASPLLLALLTMIHSEEAKLPDSRAVLCDKAVEYMLADAARWRVRDAGQETTASPPVISLAIDVAHFIHASEELNTDSEQIGVSPADIRRFAGQICEQMRLAEPTRRVPSPDDLAARLLNSHGLLVQKSDGAYGFSHRSFQEFLAGQYFAAGANDREALENASKLHWREPFRLMASFAGHEGNNLFYVIMLISKLARTAKADESYISKTQLGAEMLAEIGKRRLALHKYERVFNETQNTASAESGLWDFCAQEMLGQVEEPKLGLAERDRAGVVLGFIGDPRLCDTSGAALLKNVVTISAGDRTVGTKRLEKAELANTGGFLGGTRTLQIPEFRISRYPVTNFDFSLFLEGGGYQDDDLWEGRLGKGWLRGDEEVLSELRDHWLETLHLHHEKEIRDGEISLEDVEQEAAHRISPRIQPYYWNDRRFNAPNQPVVGVNYWEAKAFCRWATKFAKQNGHLQSTEEVDLPTEFEWECASRPRDDDRIFPWGDGWDETLAHVRTNILNLRQPTPVGVYLENWPGGPCEMSGNVWEWTDSLFVDFDAKYDAVRYNIDSLEQRVVRGSSWQNNPIVAACSARAVDRSYNLFYDVGFRFIVRTSLH